ncbi:MAG: RecX family transcriptional regulator [Bacteroidetes bacterium]|nr:MAG: RecX family transcriptional regulator [Bacteroidota bacterium]
MTLSIDNLRKKLAKYCAWQDRCTFEAERKLAELGASKTEMAKTLKWLKDENFLNDARFASSFARGKFVNNKWGKQRIIAELRSRKIEDAFITTAIEEINQKDYAETLKNLALKKWKELKTVDSYSKKQKTAAFLVNKGYEADLVFNILDKIVQ